MNSKSKEIEELSDGWVLCRSKSNPGREYYFNRKTGKSSWTEPKAGDMTEKNTRTKIKEKSAQDNKKAEETRNKSVKRKSDGATEAGSSKKKPKNDAPQQQRCPPHKKQSPKNTRAVNKARNQQNKAMGQSNKRKSLNDTILKPPCNVSPSKTTSNSPRKSMPASNKNSPLKTTPTKNLANNRLSQLRAQLSAEAKNELSIPSLNNELLSKKSRIQQTGPDDTPVRPKPVPSDTQRLKTEPPTPNLGESLMSASTNSSLNESFHSLPSPSQFFTANKIICSMKAQLPDQYFCQEKPKDTFADIEQGICNQATDYPVIKHPSTPPQFSEASKLVSAIKSKLSYSPKDVKTFTSAKDRMEALRASISGEIDERDLQNNSSITETSPENGEAMEVEDISNQVTKPVNLPSKDKQPENGPVVLVVDTNIFIHELSFIKDVLNSHLKGYSEQPTLIVPWRVINELDRLKDNNNGNGAICKRARAAMDYLYKSLPENNRIKGQSLRDSNSHIYPCESPDDEILNCALQQAERGRNVLLLSNDKNLCNKASMNNIKRMGISELKQIVERRAQTAADPDLPARFSHCQRVLHQLLANILENEMRAKYNNLWQHVVFKAPPWQLSDVLQCLLKHWIAVFNEVFPRIEHLVTDLSNTHAIIQSKDPKTLTQAEVANFKELCLEVSRKCQIIPEYMELAKLTVERLTSEGDSCERGRELLVEALEALWTVLSSYCAKLSTALGIPHSIEDNVPGTETLDNLTNKFAAFHSSIVKLVKAVEEVLNPENTSSICEKSSRLHAALSSALELSACDATVNREHLREFCLTDRNMLREALNKFSQLGQLLDACKNTLPRLAN